jgi:UDP-N-acetylmuramate--alanine ligase
MSGIAILLAAMGHTVTGSDRAETSALRQLPGHGVAVSVGHSAAAVAGVAAVTVSSAVPPGNVELVEAHRLGIPVLSRAEVLAAICAGRRTVAVAGTKGKSTTTAMIARILDASGSAPSFLVGADVPGFGGGARWVAGSGWMVIEADESDGTFLGIGADDVVVTNIEADHADFYGSEAALHEAFAAFAADASGLRVVGADSAASAALVSALAGGCRSFGTAAGVAVRASAVVSGRASARFELEVDGALAGPVELAVPGLHNVRNACGAMAAALALGVPFPVAAGALATYQPVRRRFDWRGEAGGVTFVDDYAHVPSAVRLVIDTARGGGWERVVAVFQPHLYSRTAAAGAGLGTALAAADVVVVTDVYAARETPVAGVTGEVVARAAAAAGADVRYVAPRSELAAAVAAVLRPGDLCLTLGAGDITTLTDEVIGMLGSGGAG